MSFLSKLSDTLLGVFGKGKRRISKSRRGAS